MSSYGNRYTVEQRLFYIGLVESGMALSAVEREYGVAAARITEWTKRYAEKGIDGLKPPRKHKDYSEEFKIRTAEEYIAGGITYKHLARKYEIPSDSLIRRWVSLYTSGKQLKPTRRKTTVKDGRKTTQTERLEITQWTIANENDYVGAAKRFNVSYGQVYSWVGKFRKGGPDALADRRGKAKEDNGQLTEVERLTLENKRLQARLTYVSTEAALLKKIQEIERRDAAQMNNIVPFNNSHKK